MTAPMPTTSKHKMHVTINSCRRLLMFSNNSRHILETGKDRPQEQLGQRLR
jgi:hypothetical protein